jgi:hypothetical protein
MQGCHCERNQGAQLSAPLRHPKSFPNLLSHDATHRQSAVVLSSKAGTSYFGGAVHIRRLE